MIRVYSYIDDNENSIQKYPLYAMEVPVRLLTGEQKYMKFGVKYFIREHLKEKERSTDRIGWIKPIDFSFGYTQIGTPERPFYYPTMYIYEYVKDDECNKKDTWNGDSPNGRLKNYKWKHDYSKYKEKPKTYVEKAEEKDIKIKAQYESYRTKKKTTPKRTRIENESGKTINDITNW